MQRIINRNKYIENNLYITLVIYQESLHDARSTKCKNRLSLFHIVKKTRVIHSNKYCWLISPSLRKESGLLKYKSLGLVFYDCYTKPYLPKIHFFLHVFPSFSKYELKYLIRTLDLAFSFKNTSSMFKKSRHVQTQYNTFFSLKLRRN